jgi:hypothetical protein
MSSSEYLKDLSDQIRSEIREFYTVNAAFILANSFLINLIISQESLLQFKLLVITVIFLINSIWFLTIRLANAWIGYWRGRTREERIRTIWDNRDHITLLSIKLRNWFYCLPFGFSLLFLIISYPQPLKDILDVSLLLGLLVVIIIAGFKCVSVIKYKTLKFDKKHILTILSGEKAATWRLFDDKDLKEGDEVVFLDKETKKPFVKAKLLEVKEKIFKDLTEDDKKGHEEFKNDEEMLKTYSGYYKTEITAGHTLKNHQIQNLRKISIIKG